MILCRLSDFLEKSPNHPDAPFGPPQELTLADAFAYPISVRIARRIRASEGQRVTLRRQLEPHCQVVAESVKPLSKNKRLAKTSRLNEFLPKLTHTRVSRFGS